MAQFLLNIGLRESISHLDHLKNCPASKATGSTPGVPEQPGLPEPGLGQSHLSGNEPDRAIQVPGHLRNEAVKTTSSLARILMADAGIVMYYSGDAGVRLTEDYFLWKL